MLKNYSSAAPLNIGAGEDISIADLALLICECVGFDGDVVCDQTKPDGTFRKLMDSSKIRNAGWAPKTSLKAGLKQSYGWYLEENQRIKKSMS
ncbi:MAG: GDP-L-fucose synthase, partial [Pseudomonadota bacterium]